AEAGQSDSTLGEQTMKTIRSIGSREEDVTLARGHRRPFESSSILMYILLVLMYIRGILTTERKRWQLHPNAFTSTSSWIRPRSSARKRHCGQGLRQKPSSGLWTSPLPSTKGTAWLWRLLNAS